MKIILFVGSNPSNASTCDAAFHGSTRSSQILTDWCRGISGIKMHVNVLNQKTEDNRPLKASEVKMNLDRLMLDVQSLRPTHIVALGKTATKALTLLRLSFFEMPHPSGRNRKLNDKAYVEEKKKALAEYCSEGPSITGT